MNSKIYIFNFRSFLFLQISTYILIMSTILCVYPRKHWLLVWYVTCTKSPVCFALPSTSTSFLCRLSLRQGKYIRSQALGFAQSPCCGTNQDTLALLYSSSIYDLCVGSGALQRLNTTHAAKWPSRDKLQRTALVTASILRNQCSMKQAAGCPGFFLYATCHTSQLAIYWKALRGNHSCEQHQNIKSITI